MTSAMMNHIISKYSIWYPAFFLRKQKVWTIIREFEDTPYYAPDHMKEIQFEKFKHIISFAYHHIPFYKNKYDNAHIHSDDIRTPDDIHNLPILTKQEVSEATSCSQQPASGIRSPIYNPHYSGKKFRRSTSGSTGMPFVFYKDSLSMAVMDAILYRNYSWFGIDIGFRQARFWGHPLNPRAYFKIRWIDRVLNRIRFSPFNLDKNSYKLYLRRIEQFKAQYIYGYAQSVFQFSQYFYTENIDLSYLGLKAVILTGEMIFPYQIQIIKHVFGCEVTEEYGCTEVGVIGFKCSYGNMHLMENLLIEEQAGNIIVSELCGSLFPFIRYQIGDRGIISHKTCPCGRKLAILENISGRKDDFIQCPDGKLTDPYLLEYIINELPSEYGKIFQFRIFQKKTDTIEMFFVIQGDLKKIEKYIRTEFNSHLSSDMKLFIHFADSLPKDKSGKLRCFVSELERR